MNRLTTFLRIELSSSALTVVRTRRWPQPVREVIAARALDDATPADALQPLRAALAEARCAGLPAAVVLGNDWGRMFMVTAPRNAESLRDCEAAAQLRFQQLYGESGQAWILRADWDAHRPFLACAMPDSLLAGLRQAGDEHRLTLVTIRPQFIDAWNRWCGALQPGDWFGAADAQALTLGIVDRGQLVEVRRLSLSRDAGLDVAWPGVQIAREALRLGLSTPSRLCMCGNVPAAWLRDAGTLACVRLDSAPTDCARGDLALA